MEHWLVSYEYRWGRDKNMQKATQTIRKHPARWIEEKLEEGNATQIVLLFAMQLPDEEYDF